LGLPPCRERINSGPANDELGPFNEMA